MPRPSASLVSPGSPSRRTMLVLLALVGLLLAGCAVGPSQRPPVATRSDEVGSTGSGDAPPAADAPAPAPPLLPPLVAAPTAVGFTDCTDAVRGSLGGASALAGRDLRFGCGTLPVGGRGAGIAELGVLQVSLGPVPPGGAVPIAVVGEAGGDPGSTEAVRLATRAPVGLLAGTALYGVDLRGTGSSEPVDCITPTTREALVDADPTAADPVALAPLRDAAGTAARTCTQLLEESLTDYRTATGADDVEQVRRALGVERMHAVGIGDGAGVLAAWSQRYPSSAGRTVLDGVPDATATSAQRADQQATAARAALDAFATACTARADCPLGADPARTVTDLLARLHTAPLEGPDGRRITDGTALNALVTGLGDPTRAASLATALASAGRGDPAGLLGVLAPRETDGGSFDPGVLLRCNDTTERPTLDQVAGEAARARTADPVFGAFFAQQALLCAAWPLPADVLDLPTAAGAPPLLLGTEADPRTPLAGTERVASGLRSSTLVTWLGAGHGAYPATPCVTTAVQDYLIAGNLPRQGTVCPP